MENSDINPVWIWVIQNLRGGKVCAPRLILASLWGGFGQSALQLVESLDLAGIVAPYLPRFVGGGRRSEQADLDVRVAQAVLAGV